MFIICKFSLKKTAPKPWWYIGLKSSERHLQEFLNFLDHLSCHGNN